jgi:hypothetical protein
MGDGMERIVEPIITKAPGYKTRRANPRPHEHVHLDFPHLSTAFPHMCMCFESCCQSEKYGCICRICPCHHGITHDQALEMHAEKRNNV